jgi:uncharacterized protein
MPDLRPDPLDALLSPITPVAPDPTFAAHLRQRLEHEVLPNQTKGQLMHTELTNRPRNGLHHGDVSYITLGLPDLERGKAFYGAVLGWRFSPGNSDHGAQVDNIVPMVGLWAGEQPDGGRVHGAVLGYRVDDVAEAVAAVRAHGGTASEPHREPYALATEGHDDQGVPFYLHEMPSDGDRLGATDAAPSNGEVEGDVSYLTVVIPDIDTAHAFYGGVLGWTFTSGGADGAQVSGVAPQMGMTTHLRAEPVTPGVILCYRVDDIGAAVERVRAAGGMANEAEGRPYGMESFCHDDQGTPFYLHQL